MPQLDFGIYYPSLTVFVYIAFLFYLYLLAFLFIDLSTSFKFRSQLLALSLRQLSAVQEIAVWWHSLYFWGFWEYMYCEMWIMAIASGWGTSTDIWASCNLTHTVVRYCLFTTPVAVSDDLWRRYLFVGTSAQFRRFRMPWRVTGAARYVLMGLSNGILLLPHLRHRLYQAITWRYVGLLQSYGPGRFIQPRQRLKRFSLRHRPVMTEEEQRILDLNAFERSLA